MSDLQITGKIVKMGSVESFGANNFEKVEYLLETEGQYSQTIKFEAHKDKARDLVKHIKEGMNVTIQFNIQGNEYEGKNYVNLVSWRVEENSDF